MSKMEPCPLQFVAPDLSEPPWIPGAYPRYAMYEANDSEGCAAPGAPGSASSEFDCPELSRSASLTPDGSPSSQFRRPPSNWPSAPRLLLSHANFLELSADEPGIGEGKNDDLVPGLVPGHPFAMNVDNGVTARDLMDSIKLAHTKADQSVAATLDAAPDPGSPPLTSTATRGAACPNSLLDEELAGNLATRTDESWRLIQPLREHGILQRATPMDHDEPPIINDPSRILSIVTAWSRSFFEALSHLRTSKSSLTHGDQSERPSPHCRSPGPENRHPPSSTWSDNSSGYEDAVQYQTDHILPLEFFEFPDQSPSWENDKYLHTWLDAQISASEDANLASKDAESLPTPPQAQGTASESSSKANGQEDALGDRILHPKNASSPEVVMTAPEEEEVLGSEGKIPELERSTDKDKVVSITEADQSSKMGEATSTNEADLTPGEGLLPANRDVVVSKSDTGPSQPLPLPKQASTTKKKGAACQQASQPGKPKPALTPKVKNTSSPTQVPGPEKKPPVVKEKAKVVQKTPTWPGKTPVPKTQPAQKGKQGGTKPKKGAPQQATPPKKGTTCPPPPPTGKTAAAPEPRSKPAATGPALASKSQKKHPHHHPPPPPKAPSPPKPTSAPPPPKAIPQFTGKVIISPHNQALHHATLANNPRPPPPFGPRHLTLYTDASWSHPPTFPPKASMAIVHRLLPSSPWSESAYTISASHRGRQSHCEILAIEAALGIAKTTVQRSEAGGITRVTVFSDAQPALDAIGKPRRAHTDCFARGAAYSTALAAMGVELELRWVPGHCGVEGNERADKVAGLARVYGPDPDSGPGGVLEEEEPRVMRLPVAVLRGFAGVLGAMRGMGGGMGGEEEKVAGWLGRAAREEGWVVDLNEEGEGFG